MMNPFFGGSSTKCWCDSFPLLIYTLELGNHIQNSFYGVFLCLHLCPLTFYSKWLLFIVFTIVWFISWFLCYSSLPCILKVKYCGYHSMLFSHIEYQNFVGWGNTHWQKQTKIHLFGSHDIWARQLFGVGRGIHLISCNQKYLSRLLNA